MTKAEFARLLHNGHGRALLNAREHDVSAFRDVILDACLHCYTLDSHTEGTRSAYMMNLLELLPERASLDESVLRSLVSCGDDSDGCPTISLRRATGGVWTRRCEEDDV